MSCSTIHLYSKGTSKVKANGAERVSGSYPDFRENAHLILDGFLEGTLAPDAL